jgi:hypothetical protein
MCALGSLYNSSLNNSKVNLYPLEFSFAFVLPVCFKSINCDDTLKA